jgi:hypothetical protein
MIKAADAIAGYIQGLLDGVAFRHRLCARQFFPQICAGAVPCMCQEWSRRGTAADIDGLMVNRDLEMSCRYVLFENT